MPVRVPLAIHRPTLEQSKTRTLSSSNRKTAKIETPQAEDVFLWKGRFTRCPGCLFHRRSGLHMGAKQASAARSPADSECPL